MIMKLSPISTCALFGGIAAMYGIGIALMPLVTGLFYQDVSPLAANAQSAAVIAIQQGTAQGISLRMLVVSTLALALFIAIAWLDRRSRRRQEAGSSTASVMTVN